MDMVCRFVDRDMMMRYHWGQGVGHLYAYTSDLGQKTCQELVSDKDSNISDGEKICEPVEVDDGPSGDDSDSWSWPDDGKVENGDISGDDSDGDNRYLVDAMYDSDSHELSWDREYSF